MTSRKTINGSIVNEVMNSRYARSAAKVKRGSMMVGNDD